MDFDRLCLRTACTKDANFKELFQRLRKRSMLPVERQFFTRFSQQIRTLKVQEKKRRTDLVRDLGAAQAMLGNACGKALDRRKVTWK